MNVQPISFSAKAAQRNPAVHPPVWQQDSANIKFTGQQPRRSTLTLASLIAALSVALTGCAQKLPENQPFLDLQEQAAEIYDETERLEFVISNFEYGATLDNNKTKYDYGNENVGESWKESYTREETKPVHEIIASFDSDSDRAKLLFEIITRSENKDNATTTVVKQDYAALIQDADLRNKLTTLAELREWTDSAFTAPSAEGSTRFRDVDVADSNADEMVRRDYEAAKTELLEQLY